VVYCLSPVLEDAVIVDYWVLDGLDGGDLPNSELDFFADIDNCLEQLHLTDVQLEKGDVVFRNSLVEKLNFNDRSLWREITEEDLLQQREAEEKIINMRRNFLFIKKNFFNFIPILIFVLMIGDMIVKSNLITKKWGNVNRQKLKLIFGVGLFCFVISIIIILNNL
jgi:hypothetical protein